MKPPRPIGTAPRTLAAPPRLPARRPRATAHTDTFPSLAMVLATGVVFPACEAPECGPTRADELERHGRDGLTALRVGHTRDALDALGVALGVRPHGTTQVRTSPGSVSPGTPTQPSPPCEALPTPAPLPLNRTDGGPLHVLPHTTPRPPVTLPSPPRPPHAVPRLMGAQPRTTPLPHPPPSGSTARVGTSRW
jgi:hypothetical protein